MPKQYRYEGQLHTFPDNFTEPQILRALSEYMPTARLPDVAPTDRKFPFAGQTMPPVAAPQSGASPIPPLPPGFVLDKPGMFDDLIPSKAGMFDDLIPQQRGAADGSPAPGPKLIPVDHDPWAQFADAPPANNSGLPPASSSSHQRPGQSSSPSITTLLRSSPMRRRRRMA